MDILDIDEVLKDDSFIFLEEKNHDDVSNILQQWKINNCIRQQPELAQEQVYRLNSRTFTRPKRKTAQNLESQFSNFQTHNPNAFQPQPNQQQQMTKSGAPMLNLEIGGLVTTMHKSFLQDTSPPSSICSSMDVSFDCMNNSLITSADFSNINFLQSTQSLDFHGGGGGGKDMKVFDLAGKATSEGYTLIDAIRDRQTLESLTNSGDGAVIKDSQIAQIDDISLALSKTGSACSTMNNSTESVESNNRTVEMFRPPKAYNNNNNNQTITKEDMISETTFNLVENSMTMEPATNKEEVVESEAEAAEALNVTATVPTHLNETFKKPNPLDETMLAVGHVGNNTFDCQTLTPDGRCETPEAADEVRASLKRYESTPQTSHVRYSKQHYTPSLWMGTDVNLSPIVAASADGSGGGGQSLNATRNLDDTYERPRAEGRRAKTPTANATFTDAADNRYTDETFNKELQQLEKAAEDMCEMRSVIDMAQAEADLLNDGYDDDEAQFERMLNQFDQVELKEEHLKMKKSLESIKKRFKYGPDKQSPYAVGDKQSPPARLANANETFDKDAAANATYWTGSSPKSGSSTFSSTTSPLSSQPAATTMNNSSSASGERLLNRRSRLYDDFVPKPSPPLGSTSFTVLKSSSIETAEPVPDLLSTTMNLGDVSKTEGVEEQAHEATVTKPEARRSILLPTAAGAAPAERERERERDRDRFKTILIDRRQRVPPHEAGEAAAAQSEAAAKSDSQEIIVPCIDGELVNGHGEEELDEEALPYAEASNATMHRYSRRDTTVTRNSSEEPLADEPPRSTNPAAVNPNFLTYKKLKDKPSSGIGRGPLVAHQLPDAEAPDEAKPKARPEPRSLSRPRYISGLQKFSVVSKATSAGDLEHSLNGGAADRKADRNDAAVNGAGRYQSTIGRPQTLYRTGGASGGSGAGAGAPSELKSPMGIKSKSFHNLSNNFGYQNGANGGGGGGGGGASAFIKPKATTQAGAKKPAAAGDEKQMVNDVFKVPNSKLVSGLRAPGASAGRLARPSSGYYSMSSRGFAQHAPEAADLESGLRGGEASLSSPRHSIATSNGNLSSAAIAKGSLGSLTKLTTTGTGIPKPSGLRAPSNIKRSGLPKPAASLTRR